MISDIVYKGWIVRLSKLDKPHTYYSFYYRESAYKIKNGGRAIFEAYTNFGISYGRNSASALKGAQELIDRGLLGVV